MRYRRISGVVTGGALAVLAVGLALAAARSGAQEDRPEQIKRVRVAPVEAAREKRAVRFSGVIRAADRAHLSFPFGARLAERRFAIGDPVRKGDVLARLDRSEMVNAVDAATASRKEITANRQRVVEDLERVEQLKNNSAATREEVDRARRAAEAMDAAQEAAESRLREARRRLAETTLKAPFAGSVTAVGAEPGEFVRAGQRILTLSGGGALEVEVGLPESMAARLVAGTPVRVDLPFAGGKSVSGRVERVGRASEGGGSLFPAVIALPAADDLLAGMSAEVVIEIGGARDGLVVVPLAAVFNPGGRRPAVFRLDGERVVRVEVAVDGLIGDRVAVSGDLETGSEVVVTGHTSLLDGDRVEVIR